MPWLFCQSGPAVLGYIQGHFYGFFMVKPFSYQFYRTTASAWDAMYQAMLTAQKSIYWEIYIFVDDEAGNRFVDVLCDKARAGVDIKIVIDAIGSWGLSRLAEARLKGAGVEVLRYNRLHPELALGKWIGRLWRRNHRKVLIIDEEVVFLGGVNVEYKAFDWDDVYLRLSGQVTRPLLKSFARSYVRAGGLKHRVRHLFKFKKENPFETLQKKIHFIFHSPLYQSMSPFRRFYQRGFDMARESINLLTPYFVPDPAFLRLMANARRRGVKVNLFLPVRPDYKIMEWITRAYYGLAHRSGANVFLLPRMNHGKAMTVDRRSGVVGSSNVTPRSWYFNEEAGVYFDDEEMTTDLDLIFDTWKQEAHPLNLENWQKRGFMNKTKEWVAKLLENFV